MDALSDVIVFEPPVVEPTADVTVEPAPVEPAPVEPDPEVSTEPAVL